MQRIFISLFLFLLLVNCAHHSEKIAQQELEIFYPSLRTGTNYRTLFKIPPPRLFTSIVGVGDIMIGEHAIYYLDKYGFLYPFDSTKTVLKNADFTFGNLEAPFGTTGKRFDKRFNFLIPPRYAAGIAMAGFDVVNLANNHIMDFGREALLSTLSTLDSLGVKYCGAGLNYDEAKRPVIVANNDVKVGFIGCSMTFPAEFWATRDSAGTFYPREKDLVAAIKYCEQHANYTVVSFHWGQELRSTPKDYQQYFAHLSIDAGADLVLGHHPHVLQGIEIYNNRLIIYSLGNFAFASYSRKAKESIMLKTYLTSSGLLFARAIPISVDNFKVSFQPRVLKGAAADSVISYLNKISLSLNNNQKIIDEKGIIWGNMSWRFKTEAQLLKN